MTETIRKAIIECGLSRYEICKRSGVDQGHMSLFMAGRTTFGLRKLERLCPVIGLKLVREAQAKRKG